MRSTHLLPSAVLILVATGSWTAAQAGMSPGGQKARPDEIAVIDEAPAASIAQCTRRQHEAKDQPMHGLFGRSLMGGIAGAVVGAQLGHGARGVALAVAGAVIGSHATRETFALRTRGDRAEGDRPGRTCEGSE